MCLSDSLEARRQMRPAVRVVVDEVRDLDGGAPRTHAEHALHRIAQDAPLLLLAVELRELSERASRALAGVHV